MRKRWSILFILWLITVGPRTTIAQEVVRFPVKIDTVMVFGNKHTRSNIILREIPFSFPDSLEEADMETIRNRIQNLYLFNRVELRVARTAENKNALLILVTESWYFYPLPILFINDRDWSKISYGLQINHFNFRGRNEKLSVGGWLGYNPSFFFNYFNPWIGKKTRLILGLSLFHKKISNRIFEMKETHRGFDVTLGRRFNLHLESQFRFSYQFITLPDEYRPFTVSGNAMDRVPSFFFQVKWDKRDLFEYPKKGFFLQYLAQRSGLTRREPRFWRFRLDNRAYIPLYRKLSLGLRNFTTLNSGHLPIYDRVYLGFSERIRGHYSEIFPAPARYRQFDSANLMLWSAELRFPILPVRYYSWNNAPIFPQMYQNIKFGISGALFMDSGIAWQGKESLALEHFNTGYGLGLHFHLPYVLLLRVDYAWNERGVGQLIVDMGASF